MDPVILIAAGFLGYCLLRRAVPAALAPRPLPLAPAAPPASPAPRPKPAGFDYPLFTPVRGAVRTTQAEVLRYFTAVPGALFALAGILWPARDYLNKLIYLSGRPGAGKTVLMRMMMESVAQLFTVLREQAAVGLYPGEGQMRWLVVDPSNMYLPLLYQVVPGDVPIIRATPQDAGGRRWDIAKDIKSDADNDLLQAGLFPEALFQKANDPFWYRKAQEVTKGVVTVFHDRGSDWQFHDLVMPIRYPQFLKPLLKQTPRTRGLAEHELVGRLGRDVISTASSVMNRMAVAAALWRRATQTFTLTDFLDRRAVLHLAFTPDLIESLAGIANALNFLGIRKALKRNDEYNHTIFWLDEAKYLADVSGLDDIGARGRGSGLGAVVTAQGKPGLVAKWGDARVRELIDLTLTWITLSAGAESAEAFSRAVGKVEGIQKSHSYSTTRGLSETWGYNRGGSTTWSLGSSGSSGSNWGESYSVTSSSSSTTSETYQLVIKEAVLPSEVTNLPVKGCPGYIRGFAFNPDVGVFEFDAPYEQHFANLPAPPFAAMPLRPDADQRLDPWSTDDLRRLGLEPTPELIKAVKTTWAHTLTGGNS